MHRIFASATDRRGFLRFGVLAGLGFTAGCGEEAKEVAVTAPPAKGSVRENLKKFAKKGDGPPAKKAD
jgi:hypothetical protein